MKRKVSVTESSAVYKCIMKFKNGSHRVIQISWRLVATIVTRFRELKEDIFARQFLLKIADGDYINLTDVVEAKFINERTDEEYLTLA